MQPPNLDGTGQWRNSEIIVRYRRWCMCLNQRPAGISATEGFYGERGWACVVVRQLVALMKTGDLAAAWIAIELIEEDGGFAFGRLLKAECARELRRMPLNEEQKQRIRQRVVTMLALGFVPHEFRQYSRLARHIGLGSAAQDLEALRAHPNPWVGWHIGYLLDGTHGPHPERRD